jgi:hypothetical protein
MARRRINQQSARIQMLQLWREMAAKRER